MRPEIMLDLETLATTPDAAIVAIGAVKMDMDVADELAINRDEEKRPFIIDYFYTAVSARDCQQRGLRLDADTIMWWMKQSDAARARLAPTGKAEDNEPLQLALLQFSTWVGQEPIPVWGNGSDFDNVVLRNAYNVCRIPAPWRYYQSRCFRTLKAMVSEELAPLKNELAHDALEDAKWQAQYLFNILTFLKDDVPNFYPKTKERR